MSWQIDHTGSIDKTTDAPPRQWTQHERTVCLANAFTHAAPSFARINPPLGSSARLPTTAASLRVGCVVLCVSRRHAHTHGLPPFNTLCTITHERTGLGWDARLTAGSRAEYLWPQVPGGGDKYQLYLSINAQGLLHWSNGIGGNVLFNLVDIVKCAWRDTINFLFFFYSGGCWFIRSDHHRLISGRLIRGITRKQLTVGRRSVNTHDDSYYCPSVIDVSCCSLLPLLHANVLLVSLAWDTCERIFASCKSKPNQHGWSWGFSSPCWFYFKHKVVATEVLIPSLFGPILDINSASSRSEPVENLTVQT